MAGHATGPATGRSTRPGWALLGEFTRLLLLAVVLPVLLLAGALLWQASVSVRDRSATQLTAAATAGAQELEGFLRIHLAAMQVLAERRTSEGSIGDIARWHADLARINRHYPAISTLLVTDADGILLTTEPVWPDDGRTYSVADREYFQVPRRTGRGHVSNVFRGRGLGQEPLVAVSVPLLADGRFAGVLEGSIRVDALVLRRGGLEEHGFDLLLLDHALNVVQASAGMPHRPLDALGSSPLDLEIRRLAQAGSGVRMLRSVLRDGGDAFALSVPLDNGWQLVLLQPRSALEAELRRTALVLLVLLGLLLAGVLALVGARMRRLGRSVRGLLERMQQFALDGGSSEITSADLPSELSPLAEAMNELATRARASYDTVHHSLQEQSRLREELQSVAQQLLNVQEDERRTLSRELHDDIGQSITAMKLAATSLSDDALGGDTTVRREILDEIIAIADQTVHKLRNLSLLLRPPQLDSLGLEAALRGQVALLSRSSRLEVELRVGAVAGRLTPPVELACFRIAQEALTNVARHSGAKHAELTVEIETIGHRDMVRLCVSDDGNGVDPARPGGLGLLTMRERAAQLGGTVTITPRAGGGTVVCATLPVASKS
jgi:signal transduction histidine kinase